MATVIDGSDGSLSVSGDGASAKLSGKAARVPWASKAASAIFVAMQDGGAVVGQVRLSDARDISASQNMAREPRDDVSFDGAPVTVAHLPNDLPRDVVLQYGAMVRSAQIAGAMDKVLTQTVQYANERTQFGRPLGKFQAIQQELSRMAGEAAASGVIAEAPFAALDAGQNPEWQIAAAKARTSEAAGVGATVGHQTHGAIGFTYEHSLHFATRRLWSWRSEFGGARFWSRRLGERAVGRGVENFWADIVAG